MESKTIRNTIGVNEYGLFDKLAKEPEWKVWQEAAKRGVTSIEICTLFDGTEMAREKIAEADQQSGGRILRDIKSGDAVYSLTERIRNEGLDVVSCHIMIGNLYPSYITDAVPYMKSIHERTGIDQFVVSCMLSDVQTTEEYLPFLKEASSELKKEGCVLCYHNHHMECIAAENGKMPLEMVLEECPDIMLQFDIGWAWYAGLDAASFIRTHSDRICSMHLKDMAADAGERTDAGRFTAVGSGAADTAGCLALIDCFIRRPDHIIIDQDLSDGDVYEDLASGIQFVRSHL